MGKIVQLRRFVLTGMLVNGALYMLLILLLHLGFDYRFVTTLVFVLGMIWSYTQNRLWSWQSTAPLARSVGRFLLVYAVIYVAHMSLVMFLVEHLLVAPIWAVLLSVLTLVIPIFLVFDRFVFRERRDAA